MKFDWAFFAHYLFEPSSVFLHGLWLTLCISVISQSVGTAIGVAGALGTQSRFFPVRVIVQFYTWLFRGTPLLVQIVFIYTGLAGEVIRRERGLPRSVAAEPVEDIEVAAPTPAHDDSGPVLKAPAANHQE
mgnify:CR=1 FL=1